MDDSSEWKICDDEDMGCYKFGRFSFGFIVSGEVRLTLNPEMIWRIVGGTAFVADWNYVCL